MHQIRELERAGDPCEEVNDTSTMAVPTNRGSHTEVFPQGGDGSCGCNSGAAAGPKAKGSMDVPSYVFAMGRIETRFPSPGIEKEFAQVTGRTQTTGLTDRQALQAVLADRANRYLARKICWVLTIEGLDTYILRPQDPVDFDQLLEAVRHDPSATDLDVVIGTRGPIATPEMCNGLLVPIVVFDQIYSIDRDALVRSIPRPETVPEERFVPAAGELFDRIMQLADNAGSTDDHRALNYLAVRYPAIYATAADAFGRDSSLSAVEVRPSRLSGVRKVVNVVFSYTQARTDVTEKFFVRVDVTEQFPFLATKLSPYYDR